MRISFTGIRCREFVKRQHSVSLTLPPALFDAPNEALVQYTLLALTSGKMYSEVDNVRIDEDSIELETNDDKY